MIQPTDPRGVIDAATLVIDDPGQISEGELQEALQRVQQRKSNEHGRWREAERAMLGALGAVRRHQGR
jgi:hypothetical protein